MNDGNPTHALCAFALWKAEVQLEYAQQENAALRQEIERLKQEAEKPKDGLHAVPDPA